MMLFRIERLLREKLGRDCASIVLKFLKEEVVPYFEPVHMPFSPWDPLTDMSNDGIDLPLFAP